MKKGNILFISDYCGEEIVNKIATDIWHLNPTYCVIQCSDLKNRQFKDYIKKLTYSQFVIVDSKVLTEKDTINNVIDFCKNFHYTPVIITKERKKDQSHIVYLALEEAVENTVEYTLNEKMEDYEEFLDICNEYVKGNRLNDKTIQTSGGRKKLSPKA